jgi:dipeptidyl aminopeptidase/acylaminoacyl peptidase
MKTQAMTDTLAPNDHLRCDGIPAIPLALAERLARYTEFAPVDVVAWHPTRRALLITRRHGTTMQLHLLEQPMSAPRLLTDFADPVVIASFEPQRGDCLVYARDAGGDEAAQLYRLDLADGTTTLLTDPSLKHGTAVWNHAGTRIAFEALPLDRNARASGSARVTTDLVTVDPRDPATRRSIATLPGGGWHEFVWAADDRALYALEYRSVTQSAIWKIDASSGARTRILPAASAGEDEQRKVSYAQVHLTRDGRHLVYTSDEDGGAHNEFRQMMQLDLATGVCRVLTAALPWDVVAITLQGWGDDAADAADADAASKTSAPSAPATTGELACAIVNVDGRHTLHVFDLGSGDELPLPALPPAAETGSITRVRFAKHGDTSEIAFVVNSAHSPGDVYTLRLRGGRAVEQWTASHVEGIDTASYRAAEIVRWKSFDGLQISGLISRPPARFAGRRPVLVHIHGGPESQAIVGFLGLNNYFVDELGIAYVQPNVRGSTGYGKTFVTLDDGVSREDSVKDIGALLDWIAAQPDLDASRVLVAGRSYGGFMSLAVATTYADRIAASIDIVGISDFTSFLEKTETYRRDLRRVEYGDERDPLIRAFFDRVSPLKNAHRIRKPLFVVAGLNDPRVPWQEGEQIVAEVKANGVPVWHLVADNEGHVFSQKPNIAYLFYAQVLFVQRFLLD